ncbi:MAG: thioredoxin [Bacteroidales bacterium]|nr:thioredoxin [Bacteroidales bacterium]
MAIVVNDQTFQSLIATDKPVLVDFSATWCGPCKALAPTIEEVATEFEGRAVVAKADVDECPELSARFAIRSVPTVLFFKGGEVKDKSIGNVPKHMIVEKLNALL